MSGLSFNYETIDKDINLRILKSSYKILKGISIEKNLPVKYLLEDIVINFVKRSKRQSLTLSARRVSKRLIIKKNSRYN